MTRFQKLALATVVTTVLLVTIGVVVRTEPDHRWTLVGADTEEGGEGLGAVNLPPGAMSPPPRAIAVTAAGLVVAGGPRLGELAGGFLSNGIGEARTAVVGGFACVLAIVVLARLQPGFVRYDSRHPTP